MVCQTNLPRVVHSPCMCTQHHKRYKKRPALLWPWVSVLCNCVIVPRSQCYGYNWYCSPHLRLIPPLSSPHLNKILLSSVPSCWHYVIVFFPLFSDLCVLSYPSLRNCVLLCPGLSWLTAKFYIQQTSGITESPVNSR